MNPPAPDDFWVFGYGSLMWNPGFPYVEERPGQVFGYHRSLCILSTHYRGTPDNPGLVLGLDSGGSCCGRAFRVAPRHVNATLAYLDEREQVTKVYCPHYLETKLNDGRVVNAYTFVVRHQHEQYAGRLTVEEQARLVARGVGDRGTALEYLANTVEQIDALGVSDTPLHQVLTMARSLATS
ncbi:MAG: gamma-glutamylcyclotransferase [Alphaproteobacteria bacterium]|nr:gamma-glutamylcyclotransferase [Alphaproteobacteria bacterium]MBF0251560.1 gamma-glutamylcyclotransferase [Alphaproteobacteria bacterium]